MTTPPPTPATGRPALLVAGPGSRDAADAEAFRGFVRALGLRHPELPVAGGLFEPSGSPSLGEAVSELVAGGATRLAAVPLTLTPTGHAERAARAALTREVGRHPAVSYAYGRAPGPDAAFLQVLERRLDGVLGDGARTPRDRADVTVLLVGRGSTDPEANAEVHRAARLLWEGRGYAGVETAFVSPAAPDVPSGLDRCVLLGARRIVVLPYVLFAGGLPERVAQQAEGWAAAHPEVEVRCVPAAEPEPELLDLVHQRYREAVERADARTRPEAGSAHAV